MNNEFSFHRVAGALRAFGLALLFSGCRTPQAERFARPWITTKQPLTLLSANDGQAHLKLHPAHMTSNSPLKLDRNFTRDSITVVHLGPDHPPIVKTVYDTVPNTIGLVPYASLSQDGRYGFVVSNTNGIFAPESADRLNVIDLASPDLPVVQQVAIPSPWMALAHPDGRHVVVSYAGGFQVFELRDGQLVLQRDNRLGVSPLSMDISPDGTRIVASLVALDNPEKFTGGVHVFRYRDGIIAHDQEVTVRSGLSKFDSPVSLRFSPDGRRVLAPNGHGAGSKGWLDDVLVIDMTLSPPEVTEAIPQVADGIESLAFHPSGRSAVIACLDELPPLALDTYSHLAVIDLTSRPARLLYHVNVEAVPEGIEFTPDGSQLFVQCTSANHIAVFDVDGFRLKRSPYVIRVGHGPASMALGRRFGK